MAEDATALPYSQQVDGDRGNVMDGEYVGEMRFSPFSYSGSPAAGTTIPLIRLPGGKVRIIPELSYISFSDDFATNADGHLGHQAYVNADGDSVAADDNEWIDNADIGGGAVAGPWTTLFATGAGGTTGQIQAIYDAQDGLVIEVLVDTEAGTSATITGWVVWCNVP